MNKYLFAILACVVALTTACDDRDDEITSIDYDRPFSPTGLEARVQNNVNVRLMWTSMAEGATYNIEIYEEDEVSYSFTGTPVFKIEGVEGTEYTVEDLAGDTNFSAYIQAVVDGKKSNYKGVSFKTGGEQSITDAVVDGNTITVYWKDGSNPTNVVIRLNDEAIYDFTLSAEDLANGYYVVEGLEYETKYTVRLKRDDTNIGEKTATTSFDPSLGTPVSGDGADLAEAIAAIEDGGTLLLQEGTYILTSDDLGNLDKVITIQGATSDGSMPVIIAKFNLVSGGGLTIKGCELNGVNEEGGSTNDYLAQVNSGGSELSDLVYENCEIYGYSKGILYDNSGGEFDNITVTNCIIHDVNYGVGGGGGFIDLRKTAFTTFTFTNNTVYNCVDKREFIRVDDASTTYSGYAPVIVVENNTIDNVVDEASQGYFAQIRYQGATITWSNNLITNCALSTPAGYAKDATLAIEPSFSKNYYYNSPYLVGEAVGDVAYAGVFFDKAEGTVLTASPYTDPDNGDFTIVDNDETYHIINDGIGDPRWIK